MKYQSLTITEHHPSDTAPANQVVQQAVTAWLTKELHK